MACSVYTLQLCTMSCHFMQLHIHVMYLPRSLSSPMFDILIIVLNCIEGTFILKYKYRVLADFFFIVVTKEVKFIFLLSIYKVFCLFCVSLYFVLLCSLYFCFCWPVFYVLVWHMHYWDLNWSIACAFIEITKKCYMFVTYSEAA